MMAQTLYRLAFLGGLAPYTPSRVIPVFRLDNSTALFVQMGDDDGELILGFRGVSPGDFLSIIDPTERKFCWVGGRFLHAALLSGGEVVMADAKSDFISLIECATVKHQEDRHGSNIFSRLEVSRYVGDEEREVSLARDCAIRIASDAPKIARAWVRNAQLSVKAAEAALHAIDELLEAESRSLRTTNEDESEILPFGRNIDGMPLTHLHQPVTVDQWRQMSDQDRYGPYLRFIVKQNIG